MRIAHFFIDRPIFAGVISILIALMGAFAFTTLPVAQYPQIAPPTIQVSATYPGASAEVLADTVATPLEQQINGVQDMLYMSSSSTDDGQVRITVTFKLGADLNNAQVLVQNRVATALPRLPQVVRDQGVNVRQQSSGFMAIVALYSPDGSLDPEYIGNYANSQLRDLLLRQYGVGDVNVFGGGNYAMRIWIDPEKAAERGLSAANIVAALQGQNIQIGAGSLQSGPFGPGGGGFQLSVQTRGRLVAPDEFADVIVKSDADGRLTRVRDIGRVELGSQDYSTIGYFNGQRAVAMGINQQPGANLVSAADGVFAKLAEAKKNFPPGLDYSIAYTPVTYVKASITEVQKTLAEALILVTIVVIVFLQTWRAAVIPVLAIPISLLGSIGVLAAFGFSLNNLTLFALVLSIGVVVDDAIVVVENVERNIRAGQTPREAAHTTMDEVSGALVAIALVLTAVFIPTAFIPGISGQFYKQFALTIASATGFSLLVSLTLSPALAALLLKPHSKDHATDRSLGARYSRGFNKGFDRLSDGYAGLTGKLIRISAVMLALYAGLILLTVWRFTATPTGFIPQQDQGYFIGVVQLPPGSSLQRTDKVMRQAIGIIKQTKGIAHLTSFAGLDGSSFSRASNAGTMFIVLDDEAGLRKADLDSQKVLKSLGERLANVDAKVLMIPPPPVPGIGNGGGFKMLIEDQSGAGYRALEQAAKAMMGAASQETSVRDVFTTFNTATPTILADVDRQKAEAMGLSPSDVFTTLQIYLGSTFVNDFNFLGRTFQVTAQADAPFRNDLADVGNLKARSSSGKMVPVGSVATLRPQTGSTRVVRYNQFPAVELQGTTPPGFSTGQSLTTMEGLADHVLPKGMGYEWTELAFQEKAAGNTGVYAFIAAVVFVFLLLAAQYESVTLPLAVILIVPMCLFAAILGVDLRKFDNNVLTQIGLVVLIGLAAKNAILIVEFARQGEAEHGMDRFQAAVHAARTRLRPILMTSFAFILGVLPLVIANGPGKEMRQALGTAVFFGMIGVTLFGLMFTPVFYVICRWLGMRLPKPPTRERHYPTTAGGTPHDPLHDEAEEPG